MTGRKHRWNGMATAGLFVLLGAASAVGQTAREVEDVFWESVECEREAEVRAYLVEYPDGVYVREARACLERAERGLGLTRGERVAVQRGLAELGQAPGPADGLFGGAGGKTRRAIRGWQAAKGYLDRVQAEVLIAAGQAVEARERAAAEQTAQEEVARQAAAADDAAYAAAEQGDTAAAYGEYLEAYPAGRHASAARERQAERRAAADDAAYAAAEQGDTAAAYGEYLEEYPAGRHASAARERQAERRAAAAREWQEAVAQRRARDAALQVGETFRDALRSGGAGPEMVVVPAGTFRMGCVSGQGCSDNELPVHRVTIAEPFAVGVYEVTFAEWDACVRAGGAEDTIRTMEAGGGGSCR